MFSFLQNRISNNKSVTLQVRIPKWIQFFCGKRTCLSASLWIKGSLTVEASFVFPLFLFAMVIMMMPFSMMDHQRQVQAVLESVCEDLSRLAYVGYELQENKTEIKLPEGELEPGLSIDGLGETAMMAYAWLQVSKRLKDIPVKKLSLLRSEFMKDGEMVSLIADYELSLPFSLFRMSGISMTSQSCRRAWIGKDGGWLEEGQGEETDEIVFIGKNSTKYHQSRICHYLYNQLTGVSRTEIENLRNESGGKYHPCRVCGGGSGEQVFIMPNGSSYHGSPSCTAIIAYVKAVKKSEVAHLGACSYCSGG